MKTKKIVFFPFFKRVVPSDFENWLEKMAADGWHIDRVRQGSSLIMVFIKGLPKRYRYVYDLRAIANKDYISTYEQFGWQHLGKMASVNIWRMEYSGNRPEAFTDKESIRGRNKRTVFAISFSFILTLLASIAISIVLIFFPFIISADEKTQLIAAAVVLAIFAATLGAIMIYIHKRSRQ